MIPSSSSVTRRGLRAGCVCGVQVNRNLAELPDEASKKGAEQNAVLVAAGAAIRLLESHPDSRAGGHGGQAKM